MVQVYYICIIPFRINKFPFKWRIKKLYTMLKPSTSKNNNNYVYYSYFNEYIYIYVYISVVSAITITKAAFSKALWLLVN